MFAFALRTKGGCDDGGGEGESDEVRGLVLPNVSPPTCAFAAFTFRYPSMSHEVPSALA